MNKLIWILVATLLLISCQTISTQKNSPFGSKYSKADYRTEMQKHFKKDLPNEDDTIFEVIYKHYQKIVIDDDSFKKACNNSSIAIKAVIMQTGGKANNLYLESLISILDGKDRKDLKDQIMQESAKYDLLDQ